MKHTPKKTNSKLDRFTARMILGSRGVSKEIVNRTGYCKGHVSDMISGRRTPTPEFIDAALEALAADSERRQLALVRSRYGAALQEAR
jgi:hypothetical protein